jgi:hypothetical protein
LQIVLAMILENSSHIVVRLALVQAALCSSKGKSLDVNVREAG